MPDNPPVPVSHSADSGGVWATLGLAVMLLLPFGGMGLVVLAVVAMGMWQEALRITAVLVAGALFLLTPQPGADIGARLWPALKWGAGSALLASLPMALLLLFYDDWADAHQSALLDAMATLNLAWLLLTAALAWVGRLPARAGGMLLALTVVTSRLMLGPLMVVTLMIVGEGGTQVILAPLLLAAMVVVMVLILLLGALLAWLARLPAARLSGRMAGRWPPHRVLALLALGLAAAQLISAR